MTNQIFRCRPCALAVTLACAAMPAVAVEFTLGEEIQGKFNMTVTLGTAIRTEAPDPDLYGVNAGKTAGVTPGKLNGNASYSDLNFQDGRAYSTVLKGLAGLELKYHDVGIFTNVMAWYDYELSQGERRNYGNYPNAFTRNVALGDNGAAPEASFSNIYFNEYYVFGKTSLDGDTTLSGKAGRQLLNWGASRFVTGGINIINPLNNAALQRPGVLLAEEGRLPVGMVYANLAGGKAWGVNGFVQYEFRHNVQNLCGTFFVAANFSPTGCNFVSVAGDIPDAQALARGIYPKRLADDEASDWGQFGLSARYTIAAVNTELRAYAMNLHSRTSINRVQNANINGGYGQLNPARGNYQRVTDPNGLKYQIVYPEDIKLYGLSFTTPIDPTANLWGELAYRPSQPVSINASALIEAFYSRSPNSALAKNRNVLAIAPGGTFDGYDNFKVTTASIGGNKTFPDVIGAASLTLGGEIGWSNVSGLPDPGVVPYGRSDAYGSARVNGVATCAENLAGNKCALEGFVTSNAWGYRVRIAATYPGAFFGASLTPAIIFAHDVSGNSYDGVFLDGRWAITPAVRADWGNAYFAEVRYVATGGGAYNILADRDYISLVVGARF